MFAEHPSTIDTFNQAADFLKAMSSLSPPEKMFWHVFQCALSVSVSIQVYQKCLFAVLQLNIFDSPCSQCIQYSTSCIHIEFFRVFSWSYRFESDLIIYVNFSRVNIKRGIFLGELKIFFPLEERWKFFYSSWSFPLNFFCFYETYTNYADPCRKLQNFSSTLLKKLETSLPVGCSAFRKKSSKNTQLCLVPKHGYAKRKL